MEVQNSKVRLDYSNVRKVNRIKVQRSFVFLLISLLIIDKVFFREVPNSLQFTADGSVNHNGAEAGWNEVKQSGLTVLEDKHDNDSRNDGKDVANDSSIEIRAGSSHGCFSQFGNNFFTLVRFRQVVDGADVERAKNVVSKAHSHKDTWDDDVAESE